MRGREWLAARTLDFGGGVAVFLAVGLHSMEEREDLPFEPGPGRKVAMEFRSGGEQGVRVAPATSAPEQGPGGRRRGALGLGCWFGVSRFGFRLRLKKPLPRPVERHRQPRSCAWL